MVHLEIKTSFLVVAGLSGSVHIGARVFTGRGGVPHGFLFSHKTPWGFPMAFCFIMPLVFEWNDI